MTVTVDPCTLAAAEEQVARGRAASLSARMDLAIQENARRDDLVDLLAEMRAENGPATDEEDPWARAVLGL